MKKISFINDSNQSPPSKRNICSVFVTYHPDGDFPKRLKKILPQVDRVVIVDNASSQKTRLMLYKLADNDNVEIIQNNKNIGLSSALNQGMQWLIEREYCWALTLDQDTIPCKNMVSHLSEIYTKCRQSDKIAIIGSNYYDLKNNEKIQFRFDSRNCSLWKEKKTLITSGSLISMAAFRVIGPFRDDFFIDHVDHEYCLRARSKGFKIILALKPTMQHTIGAQTEHRLIGFTIKTSNHTEQRCYFRSRNHVALMREYYLKEPIWVLKLLIAKIRSIVFIYLFEKDKLIKINSIIQGYKDGIKNIFLA